jgi:hypothetical protein
VSYVSKVLPWTMGARWPAAARRQDDPLLGCDDPGYEDQR